MTKEELLIKLEPMVDMYIALDGLGRGVRRYFRSQEWYQDINIYFVMVSVLFHMVRMRLNMDSILPKQRRREIIKSELEKALISKKLNEALISMGISDE